MAQVTGFTAQRMLEIERETVTSGLLDSRGHLILRTRGGDDIDAGRATGEDATALLEVADSSTVDLTLAGAGTVAAPWQLSAQVKNPYEFLQLAPGYVGPGPAMVTALNDPYGPQEGPYEWVGSFDASGNPVVRVERVGLTKVIVGHADGYSIGGWRAIPTTDNFRSYSDGETNNVEWEPLEFGYFGAVRTSAGMINVHGLMRSTVAGQGMVVGYLPPDMRPDTQLVFISAYNGGVANLYVRTDGAIVVWTSITAGAYISLNNILFPAAGVATWTNINLPSGVTANNPALFGTPAYWQDVYGFYWYRGILNAPVAANTILFNLPAEMQKNELQTHIAVASGDGFGAVRFSRSGAAGAPIFSLQVVAGNAPWVSLAGVRLNIWHRLTGSDVYRPNLLLSQWANYGGANAIAQMMRRSDGLVLWQGLMGGTAAGITQEIAMLTSRALPRGKLLTITASNGARGRLDVSGSQVSTNPRALIAQEGSPTWFSLDTLGYVVGGV